MPANAPPVRYKTFVYRTSCEWLGRQVTRFEAPGKPALLVASPPEFKGEEGIWTPEELFVGAVDSCVLMTFAARVQRHDLPVEAYYSEAFGHLEFSEGAYRFTRITLQPTIIVTDLAAAAPVLKAFEGAVHECFVVRSIRGEIELKPNIQISRPQ